MRKLTVLMTALFLVPGLTAWADRGGDGGPRGGGEAPAASAPAAPEAARPAPARPPAQSRQPVVINLNHASSGGHNRNFPSQQPAQQSAQHQQAPASRQASYGQLQWGNNNAKAASPMVGQAFQRPSVQHYAQSGVRAAVVVHHHSYTPGYVRKKLQKLGVNAEPDLITDRADIIHTDRAHSVINFPKKGPNHLAINATAVSYRSYNSDVVKNQMMIADSTEWRARANNWNASENRAGHYYWHNDEGVSYCHYLDNSGYNWYGWYVGDQYFWTRNFNDRWWWYDADYDRWCFWNNGFWWWQDPYHIGDLYCYNNDNYIPCNSANDQVVVTANNNALMQTNTSPDGTRVVKVDSDTQDAFLYDTATPATFDPVYLASGVQSVQFSDTSNGRPLEIILKLNDGSYDMFDSQGNAYGPGAYDADQAAQANQPNDPPAPDEPSNN